ncbi:uncharacterized protein TRAVEDRAFT_60640 [Trametes versicolor FP-101664 SS1]|uniref:uncharacterized protein n=1 Tax=Trametes versicolor (strain FP-101664) TaxID=717944 RepID=UPI00046212CF|nr:uncharacterized protein TRAVEDRAFT_60640 [Trametes versicolor FP-101664 SS1]EIW54342.1 hypothetical protein TRAVEDRAFT_60640 [Trametes versicolor FP-101664 SS1]
MPYTLDHFQHLQHSGVAPDVVRMPEDQLGLVVHRSDWALERKANVFVWWPTGELIACFNDAVTPVTVQTLLRWLDGDIG